MIPLSKVKCITIRIIHVILSWKTINSIRMFFLKGRTPINMVPHYIAYATRIHVSNSKLLYQNYYITYFLFKVRVSAYLIYLYLWISFGTKLFRIESYGLYQGSCFYECFIYKSPTICNIDYISLHRF